MKIRSGLLPTIRALEIGSGYHIPTYTEWFNVGTAGNWRIKGTWNSGLKIHDAGYLTNIGSLADRGWNKQYWSSTQSSDTNGWALDDFGSIPNSNTKEWGFPIRCVK